MIERGERAQTRVYASGVGRVKTVAIGGPEAAFRSNSPELHEFATTLRAVILDGWPLRELPFEGRAGVRDAAEIRWVQASAAGKTIGIVEHGIRMQRLG